jgi:putative glutamine amidotransferase
MMRPVIGISSRLAAKDGNFLSRASYINAVAAAGAIPLQLPILAPESAEELIDRVDGLLITGGQDVSPLLYGENAGQHVPLSCLCNDEVEVALIREASRRGKPVFGICRGIQIINVCFGGTLWQDVPSQIQNAICHHQDSGARGERIHSIRVEENTRLAEIMGAGRQMVNSYHHQAVRQLGQGLRVTALAPDGVVEALENEDASVLAVQWHPEALYTIDEAHARLFSAFIARCTRG